MRSLHAGASCVLHGSSHSARPGSPRLTGKNIHEPFTIPTLRHEVDHTHRLPQLRSAPHSVAPADSGRDNIGNPARRIPHHERGSGHGGRNQKIEPRLSSAFLRRSTARQPSLERRTGPFWHDTSKRSGAKKLIGSARCCKRQVEVTAVATAERSIRSSRLTTTTTRSLL